MKNKLSHLIDQAKKPETYLNDQEVMEIIGSGEGRKTSKASSYRPNRIRRFFKPLMLIVMTTLIAVFSLILVLSPTKDIPDTKVPIDHAGSAARVGVSNDSLQNRVTSQVLIPQNPVKTKSKLKSKLPEKVVNPKVVDKGKVVPLDKADSMANSKIDGAPESKKFGINPIALDSLTLKCIGIKPLNGGYRICYIGPWGYHESIHLFQFAEGSFGWTLHAHGNLSPAQLEKGDMKPIKILAITTGENDKPSAGQNHHLYGSQLDPDSFNKLLAACIPFSFVMISSYYKTVKVILWIVPTEDIFNCLPDSIGVPMGKEFKTNVEPIIRDHENWVKKVQLVDPKRSKVESAVKEVDSVPETGSIVDEMERESVPCRYFTSYCEGLPGLDYLNAYPNPTSDILNLDVVISQAKKITYRVFDISGRVLNDKIPTRDYSAPGKYTEKMDLSALSSGLYLFVLTDNEGARMTRRILKN